LAALTHEATGRVIDPAEVAGQGRMTDGRVSDESISEEAIKTFADRLEAYAAQLPEREREALQSIIIRATDPIERIRWRDVTGVLEPHEEAFLRSLADETQKGGP
jgi:hypothetical protein